MVKFCPIFIIAASVIILMSFGVLCYLIRTINPKPIPENARIYETPNMEFLQEFEQDDNLEYGLEKNSDNVTLNVAQPANTIHNINSFPSGDGTLVPPFWPEIKQNYSDSWKQGNETKTSGFILSQIKGQRRSIKDDDEYLNDNKKLHSLILNLGDNDDSEIIIRLGTENTNTGRSRKKINRQSNDNKTIITIEVNESLLLNIIANAVDINTKNEVERNTFQNKLAFDNSIFKNRTELNNNYITIYNMNLTDVDTATNSFDISTDTSTFIVSESNNNTNTIGFVKNLTEELDYDSKPDTTNLIANAMVLDKLSTLGEINNPVVDLLTTRNAD